MNKDLNSIGLDKKPLDTTVVSDGFLSKPIEFKSLFIRWFLYLFTI